MLVFPSHAGVNVNIAHCRQREQEHRQDITRFGDFRLVEEWYEHCEHPRVPRLSGASIGDCSPVGCVT
jgi:hypothetical protein